MERRLFQFAEIHKFERIFVSIFCSSNNSFDPFTNFLIRRISLLSIRLLNEIQRYVRRTKSKAKISFIIEATIIVLEDNRTSVYVSSFPSTQNCVEPSQRVKNWRNAAVFVEFPVGGKKKKSWKSHGSGVRNESTPF